MDRRRRALHNVWDVHHRRRSARHRHRRLRRHRPPSRAPGRGAGRRAQGRRVTLVSIDPQLAQELTYAERVDLEEAALRTRRRHASSTTRSTRSEAQGNRLVARFRNLYTGADHRAGRRPGHRRARHGAGGRALSGAARRSRRMTASPTSRRCWRGRPQPRTIRPEAHFELHRIGDAVASRNVQAAVLDALRLCRAL